MAESSDSKHGSDDLRVMLAPPPPNSSMTQSLKQLLVQCTSTSTGKTNKDDSTPPRTLTAEDRDFIEAALESTVKVNEVVNSLRSMIQTMEKMCIENPPEPTKDQITILEYLEEATEELHNGDEFISLGGIRLCCNLLNFSNSAIVETNCNIIANVASNNLTFQAQPDGNTLLKRLVTVIKTTTDSSIKTKLLYATSCILSSNDVAIQFLLNDYDSGLDCFLELYTHEKDLKVKSRTGRIIGVIFRDVSVPEQLNPDLVLKFISKLLDAWWGDEKSYVFNLELLHSIYKGQSSIIKQRIKEEFSKEILVMVGKMKALLKTENATVNQDNEDTLEVLATLERSLLETR